MAAQDVKRRHAAILAADMVGYSQLMETDEVGTLADRRERNVDDGPNRSHDRG